MHGFCGNSPGEEGYGKPRICKVCEAKKGNAPAKADKPEAETGTEPEQEKEAKAEKPEAEKGTEPEKSHAEGQEPAKEDKKAESSSSEQEQEQMLNHVETRGFRNIPNSFPISAKMGKGLIPLHSTFGKHENEWIGAAIERFAEIRSHLHPTRSQQNADGILPLVTRFPVKTLQVITTKQEKRHGDRHIKKLMEPLRLQVKAKIPNIDGEEKWKSVGTINDVPVLFQREQESDNPEGDANPKRARKFVDVPLDEGQQTYIMENLVPEAHKDIMENGLERQLRRIDGITNYMCDARLKGEGKPATGKTQFDPTTYGQMHVERGGAGTCLTVVRGKVFIVVYPPDALPQIVAFELEVASGSPTVDVGKHWENHQALLMSPTLYLDNPDLPAPQCVILEGKRDQTQSVFIPEGSPYQVCHYGNQDTFTVGTAVTTIKSLRNWLWASVDTGIAGYPNLVETTLYHWGLQEVLSQLKCFAGGEEDWTQFMISYLETCSKAQHDSNIKSRLFDGDNKDLEKDFPWYLVDDNLLKLWKLRWETTRKENEAATKEQIEAAQRQKEAATRAETNQQKLKRKVSRCLGADPAVRSFMFQEALQEIRKDVVDGEVELETLTAATTAIRQGFSKDWMEWVAVCTEATSRGSGGVPLDSLLN